MTDGPFSSPGVRVSDPQVMRALAHPARIEIMDYLHNNDAGVTATECAGRVGLSPSATSYHLRELAKYGLVEQAASRGDGRERVWRAAARNMRFRAEPDQPGAKEAERTLADAYLTNDFQKMHDWAAREGDEPEAWREASLLSRMHLLLTAEELAEVNKQVMAVLEPYRAREREAGAPEGARRVLMHYLVFPDA
ncbi:winged helix-turn-helix transcriptional regulator [Actinoplanes sp. TBRC 11911]|uniref:ArsR/SmtB family transcription factor n=1 Tax=Actinoplanes sp. TBRC 11911 TaxID=2729386 RepID=UPI00145F54C7|nr:winged helix-turn-helix domain-containing protein [Actinoplanes sp. TBRC 11911]NMO54358.1 winged helix-turn-helix transcriptional regulator [Actinoplanes sp. TBRC 11911]